MELDVFVEDLGLGIEYQSELHFFAIDCFGGEIRLNKTLERDREKRAACANAGIKLVEVDYMWNGTKETLLEMIGD